MSLPDPQGEIFRLDPDAVRSMMLVFEDLQAQLHTQSNIYEQALQEAEIGDPHGYLTAGLNHGYTSIAHARTVEAMLAEVIRNTYATVNDFEQLDQSVAVPSQAAFIAPPLTTTQTQPAMLVLGNEMLAEAALQAKPFTPTTLLPGGPAFDADGKLIRFDLTVAEFEMLTAEERIHWVLEMERTINRGPWFHNIIDIITFFDGSATLQHMRSGSWMSWADAGVLEAIQNGYVLQLGLVPVSMSGGAAEKWKDFIKFIISRSELKKEEIAKAKSLWAIAEQQGVNYGLVEADREVGRPIGIEGDLIRNFLGLGNLYRGMGRFPNGGGMVGSLIAQRVGTLTGSVIDTAIDDNLWWLQHVSVPGSPGPLVWQTLAHSDPFEYFGGKIAQLVGGNTGYSMGEALTEPRTNLPLLPHGPAYYFAQLIEQETLKGGGTLRLPPGYTILPAGDLVFSTGTQLTADGTLILTDGTHIFPDGSILDGNGVTLPTPDGVLLLDNGSLLLPNGYQTVPLF